MTEINSAWDIKWTPGQVARFWDWMGAQHAMQEIYFSRQRGDAILDAAQRFVSYKGTILDLGAGPGYLSEKLLRRGARVIAADTSPASVAALQARLGHEPRFLGAHVSTIEHVPLPDANADAIFVIETVEHLDDIALKHLMTQANRLLKVSGKVIVTTPNRENLDLSRTMCPNCGCVFHTMQHVRSWSAETLSAAMQAYGFETRHCAPTCFSLLPRVLRPLNRYAYTWSGMILPHLMYVGQKH